MSSSTGITQHGLGTAKFNWLFFSAVLLLICCSCIHSRPTYADPSLENELNDSFYPSILFADHSRFVERATPRLGRASPRLGRASPRLGRRAVALLLARLNHANRYYDADNDATNDDQHDLESETQEKRAIPRLGRAIKVNEQ